MNQISSLASRILFVASFVLAGLAVWEKLANALDRRLVFLLGYTPSRLIELAAIALLFVIALQLRELKHAQMGSGSS